MIKATELNKGTTIKEAGALLYVLFAQYHSAGKSAGVVHTKLKDLKTGNIIEKRYNGTDKLEDVNLDRYSMEFLYDDADSLYFMNPLTFDQVSISKGLVGDAAKFLQANMRFPIDFYDGVPVNVVFPEFVELKVASASVGVKQGDVTYKPATMENGLEVMVPHFIKAGETIRIEVATGKYAGKAQKVREEKAK